MGAGPAGEPAAESGLPEPDEAAILEERGRDYKRDEKGRFVGSGGGHRSKPAAGKGSTTKELLRLPQVASSAVIQKVEKREYSLHLSRQQYDKHCSGTRQYDDYAENRAAAGRDPQSRLNISFEEAQKVIEDYSGTGITRVKRDGTAADVEFITCKTTLGEYFENGK